MAQGNPLPPSPTASGHKQLPPQATQAYVDSSIPYDDPLSKPSPQTQADLAERTLRTAIKANLPPAVIEQLRAETDERKAAAEAAKTLLQRITETEGEVTSWAKKFLEATALYDQRVSLLEEETNRLQAEADEAWRLKQ